MPKPIREIRIEGNIAYVPLTQGYEAIIDAADVHLIDAWNWCATVVKRADGSIYTAYAMRGVRDGDKMRTVFMHRVIAQTQDGLETDHLSGNGLDNRRENLRNVTHTQNMRNRRINRNNTSGIKGVTWCGRDAKWRAKIKLGGKTKCLGRFADLAAATAAYAAASAAMHGEFGRLA